MKRTKGLVKEIGNSPVQKRRQKKSKYYDQLYSLKKSWQPTMNTNMESFRALPKQITEMGLSLAALAVYPVLCCEANFKDDNWFQVSEEVIAQKAGMSVCTVRKAIKELEICIINNDENTYLLERQKHQDEQIRYWMYKIFFIRKSLIESNKDTYFQFRKSIIEMGIWQKLSLRAKALYLVMRAESKFDFYFYCLVEGYSPHETEKEKLYQNREWDTCNVSLIKLCNKIGMSSIHINKVCKQLEKEELIEGMEGHGTFVVYLQAV